MAKNKPESAFITALAVFDGLFVLSVVISYGLTKIIDANFEFSWPLKQASDAFFDQMSGILYTCSVYCTLLLTVVRYIAVCHSRKNNWIKKSKIKIYIGCVIIFALIWNFPKWFPRDKSEVGKLGGLHLC